MIAKKTIPVEVAQEWITLIIARGVRMNKERTIKIKCIICGNTEYIKISKINQYRCKICDKIKESKK